MCEVLLKLLANPKKTIRVLFDTQTMIIREGRTASSSKNPTLCRFACRRFRAVGARV